MSRTVQVCLLLLIATAGLALRVEGAFETSTLAHPDEVFQTLEPAHRLAFGYGVITWEWRDGIRSWVFPAFLAGVMKSTSWIGPGSSGYLLAIRMLLVAISMVTIWFGFSWARRAGGLEAGLIAAAACATWYEIVEYAPRAMTEVVATHVMLAGLYIGVCSKWAAERRRLFLAALLCGTAISLRIQLAPAFVFAGLYFFRRGWRETAAPVLIGMLVPIAAFGITDLFTWGHAFQSFYLYFWENVAEGKSRQYGEEPWYWYLLTELEHLGPVALLAIYGARRSPFLGWTTLIIVASHSVVSHKEVRFLYPILPFVMVLAALGIVQAAKEIGAILNPGPGPRTVVLTGFGLFLLSSWLLANPLPYSGGMKALESLSQDPSVCGVGVRRIPWFTTGGYSYLHRNIPLTLMVMSDKIGDQLATVNAVITDAAPWDSGEGFVLSECSHQVCIYRRTGRCVSSPANTVNMVLKQGGL